MPAPPPGAPAGRAGAFSYNGKRAERRARESRRRHAMKLHSWEEVELERLSDAVSRRVIHSERMTTARILVKKGGVVPRHSHENEQISHVLQGSLLFQFDDREVTARAGDLVEIASREPHRVVALEDSVAMDVFQPVRQDWIQGDDTYLRKPSGS